VGGAGLPMRCWWRPSCSFAFVDFTLLDQLHGTEELRNGNHHTDDQAGKGGRKYDRPENRHSSVTGKRVGVADVVRGIMNGADMGEANHPDDENAQGHRQHSLSDNV